LENGAVMKKAISVPMHLVMLLLSVWIPLAATPDAGAAKTQDENPGEIVVQMVLSTAAVDAIDYEKRTVTFKLGDGTPQTFKVGQEERTFDQVKVGDLVNTTFVGSLTVSIRTSNAPPSTVETQTALSAPNRGKSTGGAASTLVYTAKMETIDHTRRTVTIKSSEGNMKILKVGSDVTNFGLVKEGDHVFVMSRESLAIMGETAQR
jgi:hypothetical protein